MAVLEYKVFPYPVSLGFIQNLSLDLQNGSDKAKPLLSCLVLTKIKHTPMVAYQQICSFNEIGCITSMKFLWCTNTDQYAV